MYYNGDEKIMNGFIKLENVSFAYQNQPIFTDLNLTITKGEHIAIVGANGSGKTTLLRLMSGILTADAGTVTLARYEAKMKELIEEELTNPQVRQKIGVVLQNPEDQFVGGTVRDDIAFGLENRNVLREEMEAKIQNVAKITKIEHLLDKAPHQLSGGQKQRVAIASSLVLQPEYLMFDEATSQLDPLGKNEVMKAIRTLQQTSSQTIIMVTHDLSEILEASRVIVLSDREIIFDTTPQELFMGDYDLTTYHLQPPAIFTYSKKLQDLGVIKHPTLSIGELVELLCK